MRKGDQKIAALPGRGDPLEQPRGRPIAHDRKRDAAAPRRRRVLGRMVRDRDQPHTDAVDRHDRDRARGVAPEPHARNRDVDVGGPEQLDGVLKCLLAEVERVIVG